MSNIEAHRPAPVPIEGPGARESSIGFIVVIAISIAVALAAAAMLARSIGEPVVMTILALLAMIGAFSLLAWGAGFVRIGLAPEPEPLSEAYLDQLADGVQIRSASGRALYSNHAFRRLTGLTAETADFGIEHALADRPELAEPLLRLCRAAERGYEWEETVRLPAAGEEPVRIAVAPFHAGNRQGGERLAIWRIHTLAQSETDALSQLPEPLPGAHLQQILEEVPAGVVLFDDTGRVLAINRLLTGWTGTSLADGKRLSLGDVLGQQAAQSLEAALAGDTVTGVPVPIAVRAAGGGAFAARALVRRSGGADSPGLCILAREGASALPVVTDDTAAARFIQLFHAAPIAIATVGSDGRIGHFNAAFDAMFRTSTGAPVATGGSLIERVSPETRAQVAAAVAGSAQSGIIAPVNFGFGEKGERSGRLYLSRLAVPAGRTSDAMVVYAIDTTQERELELQFAQSQKMQAIGQLAGGVAHDFNNMLTVIIGFSELLLANHRPTDPSFRDIMEIKQNANRAAGMVRQLLAYSRQQTLRPQVLSLTDFITDLSSSLLSRAIGERVRIKVQHARDLWLVKADQSQLTQVIHNLVLNARDAMPEGGRLTIRTANLPAEEAAKLGRKGLEAIDYVLCEVTDTGTGMPPEVQARIFEPFFTTKEVGKGTGLGLSTVYGIVKQTGGYIYCDSTPGKGTTFSVLLPRYLEDGRGAGPAQRPEKKEKSADLTGQGTVLLVEDEEAVRRFAVRALERQGYQVLAAGSGVEALEMIEKAPRMPDLVVSDIVMPEMDGPALLKELRKRNPGIKIIFVSGYAEEALKSLDKDAEFAFLPKPFQLKELLGLVKETMER